MKIFIFLFLLIINIYAYTICPNSKQQCSVDKINILDTKEFISSDPKLSEFSALLAKDDKLYVLGDKGRIFHFSYKIKDKKIRSLEYVKTFRLLDKDRKKLKGKYRDSEGLECYKDGKVLISFERKYRVAVYDVSGKFVREIKLNKKLNNPKDFLNENKGFEAVAYSKKYGVLTAPERPLKKKKLHKIYGKKDSWKFESDGSIVAMRFITKDKLMVLLRDFNRKAFTFRTSLISIDLKNCKNNRCQIENLATMSTANGWQIDNFEGLEKVGKNLYLMVSDNNQNSLQKSLFVLFEIKRD